MLTGAFNICCPRDCVSRHNGGTSGAPLKPLRVDSALKTLSSLRGLRGAPEVPPLCRETQSLGQHMLNAPFGINGLMVKSNQNTFCQLHSPLASPRKTIWRYNYKHNFEEIANIIKQNLTCQDTLLLKFSQITRYSVRVGRGNLTKGNINIKYYPDIATVYLII